ncbi:MAG: rhomboid family protein [Acidobacteriota bacterium]
MLRDARCHLHGEREAAARCPECRRFYCRECVVEHHGRVLCAACVAKLSGSASKTRRVALARARRLVALALGFAIAWSSFYALGRALSLIPSKSHERLW